MTVPLRQPAPIDDVELVGGHPVLDLVNTVCWRAVPERRRDRLESARDLAVLARRTGIGDVPITAGVGAGAALAAAVELRESIHPWLEARARGVSVDDDVRGNVAVLLRGGLDRARPAADDRLRWTIDVATIADVPVAFALAGFALLQGDELDAIRECERTGCGWLFLDRSRNHSRRWCSSSDCGNVVRARRHSARRRAANAG